MNRFGMLLSLIFLSGICGSSTAQYCGARCVVHCCTLLDRTSPDLVHAIEELNGTDFERLPSLAELARYASSCGLYAKLVKLETLNDALQTRGCVAILHVNGNHFVVDEGRDGELHRIWWAPSTSCVYQWSYLSYISSSVALVVAGDSQESVDLAIRKAETREEWYRKLRVCAISVSIVLALIINSELFGVFRFRFSRWSRLR